MGDEVPESGITLTHLCRATIRGGERRRIDGGPFGNRLIVSIEQGRYDGERLAGNVVGAGGDWAVPGPDGAMLLDVRQIIETDDGAIISVSYHGRADRTRGTYTIAPTFETADPRYSWLNLVQAVGKGRQRDGFLVYEIFEVR